MIELDRHLARLTRRFGTPPGMRKLLRLLRESYARAYRGRPERMVKITDFDGVLRMKLDRSTLLGSVIHWNGLASTGVIRTLKRLIRPAWVVADVGAHMGEFTLVAAHRAPRGTVLAFEPVPEAFSLLHENVRLNRLGHARLFRCSLGDAEGEREMFLPPPEEAGAVQNPGSASFFWGEAEAEALGMTPIHRLDGIFPATGLRRLDLVKIDVEGAELSVLRGAQKTIARYRPALIIEINRKTFGLAGYDERDLQEWVRGMGYGVHPIGMGLSEDLPPLYDVLCLPR